MVYELKLSFLKLSERDNVSNFTIYKQIKTIFPNVNRHSDLFHFTSGNAWLTIIYNKEHDLILENTVKLNLI